MYLRNNIKRIVSMKKAVLLVLPAIFALSCTLVARSVTCSDNSIASGNNFNSNELSSKILQTSTAGSIIGDTHVCEYETDVEYRLELEQEIDSTRYFWLVPHDATITSGQGTTSITVSFGTTSGNVGVLTEDQNLCDNSGYLSLAVTILNSPATPGAITGNTMVCENDSIVTYSIDTVFNATSYNWIVPPGSTITSGQGTTSITVDFGTISDNVSVRAENTCGNSAYNNLAVAIIDVPTPPGAINGNPSVCENATGEAYSIDAVANATSYNWIVPPGSTITSGQGTTSITVDFGTISGNVRVRAENSCGNSAYNNLAVAINNDVPLPPDAITGDDFVQTNSTGELYSISTVPEATSYTWTVPTDATITSGQGTTSITVDLGTTSGYVRVSYENACGNSVYNELYVTLYSTVYNAITADIWMDRNLGASQQATAFDDHLAYGSLFQWGRAAEGHEIIVWTSSTTSNGTEQINETTTNATTAVPNGGNLWDGKFIKESYSPYDWLVPQDNTLWQGVYGTNNPCPSGYRLPTETEMVDERQSWSTNDRTGAFGSPLKFTCTGYRKRATGSLYAPGNYGYYWTSTTVSGNSKAIYFTATFATFFNAQRANGNSVRCIRD